MSDGERLIVLLEAKINDFEKKMKKAERTGTKSYTRLRRGSRSATRGMERDMMRSTTSINKALATTSVRIGGFGKAMTKGLAVGVVTAAMAGLTGGITNIVKGIAAVGDEAKRSGLSLEAFQEWKFVAEQNRIGIDQMVDGFKELNLRADEFVVTGAGPAKEAFERLGFSASELKKKLKDPSELMLEIIGRMKDLDRAAQIRVSDEIFGGSAGERFVELLGRGEDGLRRTIGRAHELGLVLETDVIRRADELDRKFNALTASAANMAKRVIVSIADVAVKTAELQSMVENSTGDAVGAASRNLAREADMAASQLLQASITLRRYGEGIAADALAAASKEMTKLSGEVQDGAISAQEFETKIGDVGTVATETFDRLNDIDRADFSNAISGLGRLLKMLTANTRQADALGEALPGYVSSGRGGGASEVTRRNRDGNSAPTDLAPTSSRRPRSKPTMWHENLYDPPSTGGGGSARLGDYEREIQAIKDETAALELEAVALIAVAASGKQYGNAIDFARKKAELLHAAQKSGKEITPELRAEIDALAEAYVNAGESAEQATEKLEQMEGAAERGADAISDIFLDVMDGSRSAKEAVADLLREIARIQFRKGIGQLATGGGALSWLGGLLGFASGGYTGNGGVNDVAGVVHGKEYVFDAATTSRIGVGNLDAMRSGKMPSQQAGQPGGGGSSTVRIELGEGLVASIVDQSVRQSGEQSVEIVKMGLKQFDGQLPVRFHEIARDPRMRNG